MNYFVSGGFYGLLLSQLQNTETTNTYSAYQTLNAQSLYAYAANLFESLDDNSVLRARSNLVFELTSDGNVNGFLNDVQY